MDTRNPQQTTQQGSGPMPPQYRPGMCAGRYYGRSHAERNVVFAIGVVLLVFGPAVTGYHQASMVGLALIVFCSLV